MNLWMKIRSEITCVSPTFKPSSMHTKREAPMAKALPRAYFAGYMAHIHYRKVDRFAESRKAFVPYFDTWAEAHAYMLNKAKNDLKKAQRDLASATRHLAKVSAMVESDNQTKEPK